MYPSYNFNNYQYFVICVSAVAYIYCFSSVYNMPGTLLGPVYKDELKIVATLKELSVV